jgi:hypothetical protein
MSTLTSVTSGISGIRCFTSSGRIPASASRARTGPLHCRVSVTDQYAMPDQQPVIWGGHRAYYLAHERIIGKWCRAEDL